MEGLLNLSLILLTFQSKYQKNAVPDENEVSVFAAPPSGRIENITADTQNFCFSGLYFGENKHSPI